MVKVHMGELVEKVIKKTGANVTELASAMGVSRRTIYNWYKEEVISVSILNKLSREIGYDFRTAVNVISPAVVESEEQLENKGISQDDKYWQSRYIELLERYSELLSDAIKRN
jgi:transcriptional regulator with XRE-family HTH domain